MDTNDYPVEKLPLCFDAQQTAIFLMIRYYCDTWDEVLHAFARDLEPPSLTAEEARDADERLHRGIEDILAVVRDPGYTWEDKVGLCGNVLSWTILDAEESCRSSWAANFPGLSLPAWEESEKYLRSKVGLYRRFIVEERAKGLHLQAFECSLPPLDRARAYDRTYLEEELERLQAYCAMHFPPAPFLERLDQLYEIEQARRKAQTENVPPPPIPPELQSDEPLEEQTVDHEMELLHDLLSLDRYDQYEFLELCPEWFKTVAEAKEYDLLPRLSALHVPPEMGWDFLVELWPDAFRRYLQERGELRYKPLPPETGPPDWKLRIERGERLSQCDKRAMAWREYDRRTREKGES
jgi:hypothetical protein